MRQNAVRIHMGRSGIDTLMRRARAGSHTDGRNEKRMKRMSSAPAAMVAIATYTTRRRD